MLKTPTVKSIFKPDFPKLVLIIAPFTKKKKLSFIKGSAGI